MGQRGTIHESSRSAGKTPSPSRVEPHAISPARDKIVDRSGRLGAGLVDRRSSRSPTQTLRARSVNPVLERSECERRVRTDRRELEPGTRIARYETTGRETFGRPSDAYLLSEGPAARDDPKQDRNDR